MFAKFLALLLLFNVHPEVEINKERLDKQGNPEVVIWIKGNADNIW